MNPPAPKRHVPATERERAPGTLPIFAASTADFVGTERLGVHDALVDSGGTPILSIPRFSLVAGVALSVFATAIVWDVASAQSGVTGVDEFRARMEKWVEARKLISEEKSDWEVDRESLEATRDLLRQQKESLTASIAELEESSTAADEERRELLLQRGELQRARGVLADRIRAMEEEVLAIVPQLPHPLQEKLEPLLVQIPKDPESAQSQLGQRLMNVLGVLSQTEKFNGAATMVAETRALDAEQKVQVRTLYWGLGQAVYVDGQGVHAGIGRPGSDGWEFSEQPDFARDAKLLLDVYEGNVDVIGFVKIPVAIQ